MKLYGAVKPLTLVGILVLVGCQFESPAPEEQLVDSTTKVVKPLYDNFSASLKALNSAAESFCQPSASTTLADVQSRWKEAMNSWQAASVVNFGPVTMDSMAWKFQFWPDRKNLIRRKVETAIQQSAKAEQAWSTTTIARASVVSRGLGAVEYLLFDREVSGQASTPVRCQYLLAVTGDMVRNAGRLSRGWQGGENRYPEELKAQAGQVLDQETEAYFQVSMLLVGSLHATLETMIRKLTMPLGKERAQSGNPYLSESWRSGVSLDNLRTVLNSTHRLYQGGEGYGLDDRLAAIDEEGRLIAEEVATAYREADQALSVEGLGAGSLADAVIDQQRRIAVHTAIDRVRRIKNLFAGKVPNKLGIPLGFNANDGD